MITNTREMKQWPRVQAIVEEVSIRASKGGWFVDVRFVYSVDGQVYAGGAYRPVQWAASRGRAEAVVAGLPTGSSVSLLYDPADPRSAYLCESPAWGAFFGIAIGLLCVAVATMKLFETLSPPN